MSAGDPLSTGDPVGTDVRPPVDDLRAVDGRRPGRRGRATRRRLLDATRDLLDERGYRDLTVVDISRRAGTSPATFYQYFPDVDEALRALAAAVVLEGSALLTETAEASVHAGDARSLADAFLAFFEEHRAVLRVIDLGALEGRDPYPALRVELLNGVFGVLVEAARGARAPGPGTSADAVAGVLISTLAHVAAHRPGLVDAGIDADELAVTLARVVEWSIGAAASDPVDRAADGPGPGGPGRR